MVQGHIILRNLFELVNIHAYFSLLHAILLYGCFIKYGTDLGRLIDFQTLRQQLFALVQLQLHSTDMIEDVSRTICILCAAEHLIWTAIF
jgi:hypothetical protein